MSLRYRRVFVFAVLPALLLVTATAARGQVDNSSSLYLVEPTPPTVNEDGKVINPYLQQASYLAVAIPEPRQWQVHDLVTIIVRETSSAKSEGELETEKSMEIEGSVDAMVDLKRILTDLQFEPDEIAGDEPRVGISFGRQFEGDGEYERTDEVITRLTARVVDVKPNGTLALEARTHLANDDETVTITVTGYCRAEDVTADNSVLSTQMYDLRVAKKHTGEIRDASKKGLFTKGLDYLFNF